MTRKMKTSSSKLRCADSKELNTLTYNVSRWLIKRAGGTDGHPSVHEVVATEVHKVEVQDLFFEFDYYYTPHSLDLKMMESLFIFQISLDNLPFSSTSYTLAQQITHLPLSITLHASGYKYLTS
jgi:hypothetical protein